MNSKYILLATMAFIAIGSFLMVGGVVGIQSAEASGPNCPSKGGAAASIADPNAPNSVNTNMPQITQQPIV